MKGFTKKYVVYEVVLPFLATASLPIPTNGEPHTCLDHSSSVGGPVVPLTRWLEQGSSSHLDKRALSPCNKYDNEKN